MQLPAANTALLIVDVQHGINRPENGRRNNPQAEDNIARLLAAWRASGRPVFHVKHNSTRANSPFHPTSLGNEIMDLARPLPEEPLIEKSANGAFVRTGLEDLLRDSGITTLVIAGFVTNHCVETTARMAGDLDFDTYVVSDATAAHDRVGPDGKLYEAEIIHAVALASIHEEFVTVVDTDSVLAGIQESIQA
jgi:nicotinamidase-related amidase